MIAAPISDSFRKFLSNDHFLIDLSSSGSSENIIGIVTSNKLNLQAEQLQSYPNLKWIARMGSGLEIVDQIYCREKGIQVFSSPAGIANAVAEHLTGMLLSLRHHICRSAQEIRQGHWLREPNRGRELQHMTLGIIGYGHTGSAFAGKMQAFTQNILAYDKYKSGFGNSIVREVSLNELMERADIVSFHVPLTEETRHYYNDTWMKSMKHSHILLNASRGAVVHTPTVLRGLQSGLITGACLDVLEEESLMPELLSHENNLLAQIQSYPVIITPHIAGYTFEATEKMSEELMRQLLEQGLYPTR